MTPAELTSLVEALGTRLLPRCSRVIVAGRLPAHAGSNVVGRLVDACRRADRPVLVDASGDALVAALAARPDIVKVGRAEVEEAGVVGAGASSRDAAVALVDGGADLGVVTDGSVPVVAADTSTIWTLAPPSVEARSGVGSGDAFGAALSLALAEGRAIEAALVRGVAAGAANAMRLGAGLVEARVVEVLAGTIEVSAERR